MNQIINRQRVRHLLGWTLLLLTILTLLFAPEGAWSLSNDPPASEPTDTELTIYYGHTDLEEYGRPLHLPLMSLDEGQTWILFSQFSNEISGSVYLHRKWPRTHQEIPITLTDVLTCQKN